MAEFIQKCPHCNTDLQMQDEWICMEVACPTCQNKLIVEKAVMQIQPAADEKNCPFCGGTIKAQAVFCRHCRQELNQETQPVGKSKKSYGLLALFNTIFPGAGHIYLGQGGKGVVIWIIFNILGVIFYFLREFLANIQEGDYSWVTLLFGVIVVGGFYSHIIVESFFIYAKMQLGETVKEWEWISDKKAKGMKAKLSPEMLKLYRSFKVLGIGAGLFMVNSYGVLFVISSLLYSPLAAETSQNIQAVQSAPVKKAVKWYRKAAEQGDADAQYNLGVCYYNGNGVTKDYAEAVKWFRKAAEQGDAKAQYNLGVCYERGNGVTKDYAEAVKWYRKAAEQGHAKAQFALGACYCYDNGYGVTKNPAEAVKWFRKAAEQGDAKAQYVLGVCYGNGNGVTKDYAEAVKWFRKAAEQGHAKAQMMLKLLEKR